MVDDTVRCPWHHACFSLRTGEALRAPALDPVACWRVEQRDDKRLCARKARRKPATAQAGSGGALPENVVIVGGGARGQRRRRDAAPGRLRGPITMLSADDAAPYDRPNLSKDYLAGTARRRTRIPLRSAEFYDEKRHRRAPRCSASTAIDAAGRARRISTDGSRVPFDALLLATGAAARAARRSRRRSCRTCITCARSPTAAPSSPRRQDARARCVIGASFIGLEAAAALRERGARGARGRRRRRVRWSACSDRSWATCIAALHEEHGVIFHLGHDSAAAIDDRCGHACDRRAARVPIWWSSASACARRSDSPQQAGLAVDNGVTVNAYLETSVPRHFCGGRHRALAGSALRASASASSTGWWRSARGRRQPATCWAARAVRRRAVLLDPALRHRGLAMSDMPSAGTGSRSTGEPARATAR